MYNETAAATAIDETEFIDTTRRDDTDRRMTRWIVLAGDRMTPHQKRTFDGMKLGGDNLGHDFKTLAPTKGLLMRCRLTPMIVGHDDLNADSLGDEKGRYRSRAHFDTEARAYVTTYFNECLPGDELAGIQTAYQGVFDYGIREIEALRGVEPTRKLSSGEIRRSAVDGYQREIFPDWDRYLLPESDERYLPFFPTTAKLRTHLMKRREVVSETCQSIILTILESLAQFERWATAQLDAHSRLVKAPPTADGKVYSWETIHHQWFDLLELNKEAFLMKKEEAREIDTPSREEFNEMRDMFKAIAPAIGKLAEIEVARGSKTPSAEKAACTALKADNSACKAFAKDGTSFCAAHQNYGEKADDNG